MFEVICKYFQELFEHFKIFPVNVGYRIKLNNKL